MVRKKYCLSILLCMAILWSPVFGGQVIDGEKKKLGQLQHQIKQADSELKGLRQEQQQLSKQLKQLETQYGRVARKVAGLQSDIKNQRAVLQEINQKMTANRNSLNAQKQALEGVVRAAYAMGDKDRLKVIFNQQDPGLSSRMLIYYDYINQARLKELQAVEKKFLALQRLEQEQLQRSKALEQALLTQRQEQDDLQSLTRKRQQVVARLQQQYADKKTRLGRLKSGEKKLQQLIATLRRSKAEHGWTDDDSFEAFVQTKPFPLLKGQLPWPLKGRLTQKFGSRRAESRWDGVLIDAKEGAPIHAVARGKVVYADWLRGYGLLIIIDHGKGYMTLYAFNQSLYKSAGEKVEAGDVIASVGNSGGRSQSALYFGIRKKGKPVDPLRWCRKIHKNRVG